MEQRVSLVTLGVTDVGTSKDFYERLGWRVDPDGHPWEVAYNPGFPLDDAGGIRLPSGRDES